MIVATIVAGGRRKQIGHNNYYYKPTSYKIIIHNFTILSYSLLTFIFKKKYYAIKKKS